MWSCKNEARKFFKSEIKKHSQVFDFVEFSNQVSLRLSILDIWKKDMVLASYRALPMELSPTDFELKQSDYLRFVIPQVDPSGAMRFIWSGSEKCFETNAWGVQQPVGGDVCPLKDIDVFLVPGLAFDRKGNRLGRGKGCYDRILSQSSRLKIGVAGSYQIHNENLPVEAHDVPMDVLCTEKFVFIPLKHSSIFKHTVTRIA